MSLEERIKVINDIHHMQQEANRLLQDGKSIALVPTMGYFHKGHLSLMREGRKHGDTLIISIFVNPTQFGPTEDFRTYPRDLDRDASLAESTGVDIVFVPDADTMYDKGHQTYVDLEVLPSYLCGRSRSGHFRGVATVVAKLFNIVKPQVALFGEKDYQQLAVIRRMTRDLNYDIRVIGVPAVREAGGLAMSSRNTFLSKEERCSALSLHESLKLAQERVARGVEDARKLIEEASGIIRSHPYARIDYVALCDPDSLEDVERVEGPSLMAVAVWVGKTRLIDNAILTP